MVVAKFNVVEFTKFNNGGGKVTLCPVLGDSEENKKFWKNTPSGTIQMFIDNQEALEFFADMGQFKVTFEK
jgi:hypothetical protein